MDLSDIPFDVPVILQSIAERKSLQNPVGTEMARCLEDNRDVYEQIVLRHVNDNNVAIQSARNGRFLQVRTNGDCVFNSTRLTELDLFTMESDTACALNFVSCLTGNFLQCDNEFIVTCRDKENQGWEAWRILQPRDATQEQRRHLSDSERQDLILQLAKGGNTAEEVEQLVTRLFDVPATFTPSPAFAIPLDEKK
jgi:hypothetical protein